MNINAYVKSLKSVIDKEEVQATLAAVRQDLNTKTLPIINTAAAAFKTVKPKAKETLEYEERYRSSFRLGRNASAIVDIQTRLSGLDKNLDYLREMVEKHMPETVASSAIDRRSAIILQLVDMSSFTMRYVRRFIEAVIVLETQATGIYDNYEKDNLTKGEAEWVRSRFGNFLTIFKALTDDLPDFKKKFENIPHVNVDPTGDDVSVFGSLKMDPFMMGFIPVNYNPFFIAGKWIAEFQAWRYHEAQEDLSRIQRRILLLEEATAGKANPKLEKEIVILRSKSESLTYRINKAEEDIK